MRLARLSLAAAALIAFAACTSDATAPDLSRPSGPVKNGTYFGSGMKAGVDSIAASTNSTISAAGSTVSAAGLP